ncbi:non-specific lipid transfer protein GPI-anchored 1-like [Ananas comosus]|uniref:Non-specific lipid transfer protein GPI-anchored 1-like n=1 Tax=Ananas comosus TaxID=4615 RepID=A0A6P5F6L4_ANACO|nr:non-specific lipid transfer protein GPI-anchored 1-like [Ananas comosus]
MLGAHHHHHHHHTFFSLLIFSLLLLMITDQVVVRFAVGDDSGSSSPSPLQAKCGEEFAKLTNCLDYATAKADAPSGECCSAVGAMRKADPACLCYVIQQTHSGTSSAKSLGLQFGRLLALPTACKLVNSSITDCPRLLNLTPSSPDYAIFTNPSKATPTSSSSSSDTTSEGIIHQISLLACFAIAIISAIFVSIY